MEEKNQQLWNKTTKEYVIITDLERNIIEVSDNVNRLFGDAAYPQTCIEFFAKAHQNEVLGYKQKKYRVEVTHMGEHYVIIFRDCTKETELLEQIENLDTLAQNYEMLFNNFGDSSMYVTDGKGITTWVGKGVARTCGFPPEYFIGKSVYDLQEEGIFYPSITAKVLETLSYETLSQCTSQGQKAIAMGFPLFDKNNHLVKVISFSKPVEEEGAFSWDSNTGYQPDVFYPEIISNAPAMMDVKNMVDACCKVDSPVLLFGEAGCGKQQVARCIHKLSKRCNNQFVVVHTEQINKRDFRKKLFGENSFKEGAFYQANGGTLYFTNLQAMPVEIQKELFQVMSHHSMEDGNGMQVVVDVRCIAGNNYKLSEIPREETGEGTNERNVCDPFLSILFQALEIEIPSLRQRRKDIPLLVQYYGHIYKDRFGASCSFTTEAMQKLYEYDWPGNVRELEKLIQELALDEKISVTDENQLPEYILQNRQRDHGESIHFEKIIPMAKAVEDVERQLILRALETCKNAKEAAVLLEITPSTLSRKIQKYEIK